MFFGDRTIILAIEIRFANFSIFGELIHDYLTSDFDFTFFRSVSLTMPSNVEVKARVPDVEKFADAVIKCIPWRGRVIRQRDTFFKVPNGRLKLREFGTNEEKPGLLGELIGYSRPDSEGCKVSEFVCVPVRSDIEDLRRMFGYQLGFLGDVTKSRTLWIDDKTSTRIHLDLIQELGEDYVELEVPFGIERTEAEAREIAQNLCNDLGILPEHHVAVAYIDLILAKEAAQHEATFNQPPPDPEFQAKLDQMFGSQKSHTEARKPTFGAAATSSASAVPRVHPRNLSLDDVIPGFGRPKSTSAECVPCPEGQPPARLGGPPAW